MKTAVITKLMILLPAVLVLSSCGGGGNGVGNTNTQPTAALVKLYTAGTLASGTQIGGIDVMLHLPSGVSVKSVSNPPETDNGIVMASGLAVPNSSVVASYTAYTGVVHILLANPNGFGTGEFATVNCDITAGSHPVQTDFTVSGMTAKDLNGSDISGLNSGLTVDIH